VTGRPVVPHARAHADIAGAIAHHRAEGRPAPARRFIDGLEAAFDRLGHHPGIGSSRLGDAVGIGGLRCWPVGRFPWLVFDREQADRIDVWRVLHARRDIAVWPQEPEA
jgi:toxin ParE1/3/4